MPKYEVILTIPVKVVVTATNPLDIRNLSEKALSEKSYQSLDILKLKQPIGAISNHPMMISARLVA